MPLVIEACSALHIGDRAEQQDRVTIYSHPQSKGALMAVLADGMGGHTGGALAAEQVLHAAHHNFETSQATPESVQGILQSSIRDAHDALRLTRYTSEQDPHSTACLLVLQPGRADWAHCGDSRIYHFRDGLPVSRSRDHSHVMDLVRSGIISKRQAELHPDRNVLVSCLGDEEPPRVEFGHAAPLVAGDAFLLCSDGIWAYFPDDEELGAVLRDYAPRQAAEAFIVTARKRARGKGDNCSVAIVRLISESTPATFGRR